VIVPILGYVGKKGAFSRIAGISSDDGFKLFISAGAESFVCSVGMLSSEILPKSKQEMDGEEGSMGLLDMTLGMVVCSFGIGLAVTLLLGYFSEKPFSAPAFFAASTIAFGWFAVLASIMYLSSGLFMRLTSAGRQVARWHSCEHKSVVLLEGGLAPDRENFDPCPATLINCGSVWVGVWIELLLGVASLLALVPGVLSLPFYAVAAISIFLVSSASAMRFLSLFNGRMSGARLALFIFGIPAFVVPLLFERILALRKPSEEEIAITIDGLKKIYQQIPHA
jgi:uncharacterized protein YqhQ